MLLKIRYVGFILLCLVGCAFSVSAQDVNQFNLMPVPTTVEAGKGWMPLDNTFALSIQGNPDKRIYSAATRFLRQLDQRTGLYLKQSFITESNTISDAAFTIEVTRPGVVELGEVESYRLKIDNNGIRIQAETDLGAMHGMATVLQLITVQKGKFVLPYVSIEDSPRFKWRGLMIDVARHFQPMEVIKRNLNAMDYVKMNVLHLHLTDDQGFRVEVKSHPLLTEKGSDGFFFTQEEIKTIVQYAADRGIRVVPEFDVPGHATSWIMAYPSLGSSTIVPDQIERNAGIFDATLDPTKDGTYKLLKDVFSEMAELFPDAYFHIGGDENEGKHWDANKEIQAFMKKNDLKDNHELQTFFNKKLLKILTKLDKKMVGWDEILQPDLPKNAVIQSWRGQKGLLEAANGGYQTILSNGYYIDLLLHAESHYLVDPIPSGVEVSKEAEDNILGGETTMWSELVTPLTIDSRIWPRTAAIAERFWSASSVKDVPDMYRRLEVINKELEYFGITHIRNRAFILRNLAKDGAIEPVLLLNDLVEPMKGYTRNAGGTMHKSFNPFTLWADAAITDAKGAREFNALMQQYLQNRAEEDREQLMTLFKGWYDNHEAFEAVLAQSPLLQDVYGLSLSLRNLSALGMELLLSEEENSTLEAAWFNNYREVLDNARVQGGRTELQVVDGVEELFFEVARRSSVPLENLKADKK